MIIVIVIGLIKINILSGDLVLQLDNPNSSKNYWDHAPPSVQMVEYMLKWTDRKNIPYHQFKRAAYLETGFKGLYHFDYNPAQTSSAYAEGPMQVLYSTAKYMYPDLPFSREDLRTNIHLNIKISATYADYLRRKYRNWLLVWSFYNQGATGLEYINSYARFVVS